MSVLGLKKRKCDVIPAFKVFSVKWYEPALSLIAYLEETGGVVW